VIAVLMESDSNMQMAGQVDYPKGLGRMRRLFIGELDIGIFDFHHHHPECQGSFRITSPQTAQSNHFCLLVPTKRPRRFAAYHDLEKRKV